MRQPTETESTSLADDLLIGVEAIANFTGWTKRRVYHLIESTAFPAFKVGGVIHARRSSILEWIRKMEIES